MQTTGMVDSPICAYDHNLGEYFVSWDDEMELLLCTKCLLADLAALQQDIQTGGIPFWQAQTLRIVRRFVKA